MSRAQALRKGRYRGTRPALFDRRLLVVALLIALAFSWQLLFASAARTQDYLTAEITTGQPVEMPHFSNKRGYIHYQVTSSGRRYWYGSVAARFRVCGGWRNIVKENLKDNVNAPSREAVNDAQYKLEAGTTIKIPLMICEEP